MKKFLSQLYLFCIVIGLLLCVIGFIQKDNNIHIGKMWEGTPESIEPKSVVEEADNQKIYCFEAKDFREGRNSIYFYSSHMNVRAYVNEISNSNLIYAFEKKPSLFGTTPGSNYNIIEIPVFCEKVYIVTEAIYPELNNFQLDFYKCNGVAAYRLLIHTSVAEAFISGTLIILGIIMIILFFLCAKNKIQLDESFVYFALFTIMLGAWTFNETSLASLLFANRPISSFIGFTLLLLMQQPMLLFSRSFLKVNDHIIIRVYCFVISVTTIILIGLHMFGILELRRTVGITHIYLFLGLVYMLFCFIHHFLQYGATRRVIVNVVSAGVIVLAGMVDLFAYYASNRVNDIIGRCGMLAYTMILSIEVMSEFTLELQENRKMQYYKELAMIDTLTGLQNRNAYEYWEKNNLAMENVSLITFDLNNLKECNDTKGHVIGDQYIIDAANMIYDVFHKNGICYRIGGDEFVVVIKEKMTNIQIEKNIQKLRRREHEYNIHSSDVKMEIACGYATKTETDKDFGDVRTRADFCMYMNKNEIKKQSGE